MPPKKPETKPPDHLSSALESLRRRPNSELGLATDERVMAMSYVAGVAAASGELGERAPSARRRMGFSLPEDLCERARNAVWHLADRIGLTLSGLAEGVLGAEVARLETMYNGGEPFPERKGRLRGRVARRRSGVQ